MENWEFDPLKEITDMKKKMKELEEKLVGKIEELDKKVKNAENSQNDGK